MDSDNLVTYKMPESVTIHSDVTDCSLRVAKWTNDVAHRRANSVPFCESQIDRRIERGVWKTSLSYCHNSSSPKM